MAEWIAGQADIDKEWDSYVEQLDKLDLKEYVELRQKALNK
jgi:putative aldouronate transport system substrate-binding protein